MWQYAFDRQYVGVIYVLAEYHFRAEPLSKELILSENESPATTYLV